METLNLSPEYVHRLVRIQQALKATSGQYVSLPGLLEEIVSTWLYEVETSLALSPRQLPVQEIDGKRYYLDARLGEYRNVENPHDRKHLDTTDTPALSDGLERMVPHTITREEWTEIACLPQIREAWGLDAHSTPEEFASLCYGARFDFVSGGPGYCGDLYLLYGDALSGAPFILIRDTANHSLRIVGADM